MDRARDLERQAQSLRTVDPPKTCDSGFDAAPWATGGFGGVT
jgi:hypothetical protein